MTKAALTHKEIERKFLVRDDRWRTLGVPVLFKQGYLVADRQRVVRVRLEGERAVLTIKGATHGLTRSEFNYAIPRDDAETMLDTLALKPLITKWRTVIEHAGHYWEVDEFLGDNAGLIVAEIELSSEEEPFEKPDWIGEEVTGDPRYGNASLVRYPYTTWATTPPLGEGQQTC